MVFSRFSCISNMCWINVGLPLVCIICKLTWWTGELNLIAGLNLIYSIIYIIQYIQAKQENHNIGVPYNISLQNTKKKNPGGKI